MSGKTHCLAAASVGFHSVSTEFPYNGETSFKVNLIDLSTGNMPKELVESVMSDIRTHGMLVDYYANNPFYSDPKLRCGAISDPIIIDGMLTGTLTLGGRMASQLRESLANTNRIEIASKGTYKFIRAGKIEYRSITGFRFVFDGSWICRC